jgi:hypothetical protein
MSWLHGPDFSTARKVACSFRFQLDSLDTFSAINGPHLGTYTHLS